MKKKLAFFGGKKEVTIPLPNYVWPEKNISISKKVKDYLNSQPTGTNGLPDVIEKFEEKFKKFHSKKFALALSSGTAALHTAFFSLGVKQGDEVIVPNYTFQATVLPILMLGAKPIFCDCEIDSANIDPEEIKKKITKKTKVIAITHWWGLPCNMKSIMKIVKKNKLKLLEDCAHAPGAKYNKKLVGTFGDISCFSLDNNKLLASGEGGVLLTNNIELYERSVLFSDFGPRLKHSVKSKKYKIFTTTGIGTKYRIHFLAAKIAYEKIKTLNQMNKNMQKIFNYFSDKLKKTKTLNPPKTYKNIQRGGFYGYKVTLNNKILKKINIKKFLLMLKAEGIDVRKTVTPPLHMTNLFSNPKYHYLSLNKKNTYKKRKNKFPNSSWFHNNHLSFPSFYKQSHKKIINMYFKSILKVEKHLKI